MAGQQVKVPTYLVPATQQVSLTCRSYDIAWQSIVMIALSKARKDDWLAAGSQVLLLLDVSHY